MSTPSQRADMAQRTTEVLEDELARERHKSDAFANMSHEIRNLLTGVLGNATLLLHTELDNEQRDHVKRMRFAGEALLGIVNNVLDFSKLEAGALELEHGNLDLRRIVEEVGDLMAEPAHRKGLDLVTVIEPDVPTNLLGDAGRIRQIIVNFAGNAIKFTETGEVVIRVSLAAKPDDADRRTLIRLEVRDTGPGISPAEQRSLFQRFSQADQSTNHSGTGTGLGLAIARKLVEVMEGDIGIDSELGQGSCFWCTARLSRRAGSPQRIVPRFELEGVIVIIADHNETSRNAIGQLAEGAGVEHEIVESANAVVASLAKRADGDSAIVLLLDEHLPGLSSSPLLEELESNAAYPRLHLVLMTYPGKLREPWGAQENAPLPEITRKHQTLARPVRAAQFRSCVQGAVGSMDEKVADATAIRRAESTEASPLPVVLVVEDEIVNQRVAQFIIEKRGFTVELASSGAEALNKVSTGEYAAVFMDLHMPKHDGLWTTEGIRAVEEGTGRRVPIIAMTADVLPGTKQRCLEAGMDDYLSKPLVASDLDNVLKRWVRRAAKRELAEPTSGDASPKHPPSGSESSAHSSASRPARTRRQTPPSPIRPRESSEPHSAEVATRPPTPPTGIDMRAINQLRNMQRQGDSDIVEEIAIIFLEYAPTRLAALEDAAARDDPAALRENAHGLKGSAGQLGATALQRVCGELEALGRSGSTVGAQALLGQLTESFEQARAALSKLITSKPRDGR